MEENKKAIENERTKETAQIISESELEVVAGGDDAAKNVCCFVNSNPLQWKIDNNGVVWVKCNLGCLRCICRWTGRCVDCWHIVEHLGGILWIPAPYNNYNHDRADKVVKSIDIPVPK